MKKLVATLVILGILGGGYYYLWNRGLDLQIFQGQTQEVGRGDLSIPISATGKIQPKSRSEIKPEASGTVLSIPFEPGELVKAGDLIIQLDPEEEQRTVTRAENDVARTKAALEMKQLQLEEAQTSSMESIEATIASLDAQITDAEFRLTKSKELLEKEVEKPDTVVSNQARFDQLNAQRRAALADRKKAEIAVEVSKRNVTLAEKDYETALTSLDDARKRLRETRIVAPIDGMITQIHVEVGEVVQGGRSTFTGGTVVAVVADISDVYVQTEVSDADIGAVLWLAPDEAIPGGADLAHELKEGDTPLNVDTSGLLAAKLNAEGTPVGIRVDAFRDDEFEGIIERVYPEPRNAANIITYLVDIQVTSENRKKLTLVQGMQADVEFTAQSVLDAVLVPHEAIRTGPNGELGVYIPGKTDGSQNAKEKPEFVPCRFGLDNGLFAELIEGEGIVEGVKVYTKLPPELDRDEDDEE